MSTPTTNFTLQGLERALAHFVAYYPKLERFFFEDEDQFGELMSKGESFSVLLATPVRFSPGEFVDRHTIRLYVVDRLLKDRSNYVTAKSETLRQLNDLIVWLSKTVNLPFQMRAATTATPVNERFLDYLTGWTVEVEIETTSYEPCAIPPINDLVKTIC